MKDEVFFARWILLVIIALPLTLYAAIYIERRISFLMLFVIVVPWAIFFRKEIIEFMQDWYSLVRGRKPKRRERNVG